MAYNFNCLSKLKDFSMSQAIDYTGEVVYLGYSAR